jgi:hypothetical protein
VLGNIKLITLFLLIACIIGLSHFSGENLNGARSARETRSPTAPRVRPTSANAICCDNFA